MSVKSDVTGGPEVEEIEFIETEAPKAATFVMCPKVDSDSVAPLPVGCSKNVLEQDSRNDEHKDLTNMLESESHNDHENSLRDSKLDSAVLEPVQQIKEVGSA